DDGGDDEGGGVGARGTEDRCGGVAPDHPDRRHHEYPAERRERNQTHGGGGEQDDPEQHHGVEARGEPGSGTGAQAHRRPGDRPGRRHAPQPSRPDRGEALAAEFPVPGMPPNSPAPTEASPWPTSSRSGSYGPVSDIEAATRIARSDSIPASAATVIAGRSRVESMSRSK